MQTQVRFRRPSGNDLRRMTFNVVPDKLRRIVAAVTDGERRSNHLRERDFIVGSVFANGDVPDAVDRSPAL